MVLPDFSEFLSTLSEEKIMEIAQRVNDKNISIDFSLTEKGINSLLTASSAANLNITLEVLHLYHEWLAEKLA